MPLNLVLITSRQTQNGNALTWGAMEDVSAYQVFVAARKLSPDELEGAAALGGSDDCVVAKVAASTRSVVDDVTPAGEARFYAVAMIFKDGTVRAARFRVVPDGGTAESIQLSAAQAGGNAPAPARAAPAAARPAGAAARPVTSSGFRPPAPSAAAAPAEEDPMEARKRAQREARERASGGAPAAAAPQRLAPAPFPSTLPVAEEDPIEARKRLQREAREKASGGAPAPAAAAPAAASARAERPAEPAAAPEAEPVPAAEDPIEARKRAQLAARERAAATAPAPAATPAEKPAAPAAAAAEDPLEARKRAQAAARAARDGSAPAAAAEPAASSEPPPQPSTVALDGPLDLAMKGSTQTWDGLRVYWERAGGVAAYEIVVSDHQIFDDEVRQALAGNADFTVAVAVAPSITCVIDNVTAREARGWYSVLARARDGKRTVIPFQIGDAATSGKPVAPFLNANRTSEVRAEVEDLVGQAREQWGRWKSEQDGGARREARRMIGDALLIFPNYPAAKALLDEMA